VDKEEKIALDSSQEADCKKIKGKIENIMVYLRKKEKHIEFG
jgi:hypothetical protein